MKQSYYNNMAILIIFHPKKDENSIQHTSVYYQPPSIIEPDAYYSSPAEQYQPSATLNYEDVYAHVGMLSNDYDDFYFLRIFTVFELNCRNTVGSHNHTL